MPLGIARLAMQIQSPAVQFSGLFLVSQTKLPDRSGTVELQRPSRRLLGKNSPLFVDSCEILPVLVLRIDPFQGLQ